MARKPRIDLPGVAQHAIQRGNDRQPALRKTGQSEMHSDL